MKDIRDRIGVSINSAHHDAYINLKYSSDKSFLDCPFEDFRELYLLSAVVGATNDLYDELEKNKEKIFDSNVFSEHFDLPILYAIAYCKDKNVELLSDENYVLKVVEGYANGGFPTLMAEIENSYSSNLMNLANYIKDLLEE